MNFSGKNDTESSRNFIKNLVLDPKRAKSAQKSYGKFTESLRKVYGIYGISQDLSRRTHKTDCYLVGSLGNPRKTWILRYFLSFCWGIFGIVGQIFGFLVKTTLYVSFSGKNDAESFINFATIQFLDPKRAKLVQKSYGKFT